MCNLKNKMFSWHPEDFPAHVSVFMLQQRWGQSWPISAPREKCGAKVKQRGDRGGVRSDEKQDHQMNMGVKTAAVYFPASQNLMRKLHQWKNLVHINTSKIATSHTHRRPNHMSLLTQLFLQHCLTVVESQHCNSPLEIDWNATARNSSVLPHQESGLCV